jgi:hypothetical protein
MYPGVNRLLTFCVRLPRNVVVLQVTPTLLSGLTVKASASCCTGRLREPAECPDGASENRTKRIRPEARERGIARLGTLNVVT